LADISEDRPKTVAVTVPPESAGTRLDSFLAGAVADLSRNRAKALIQSGQVTVGGATVKEPKHPVNAGDIAVLTMPSVESAEPAGEAIPLDIVYEDDALIVINKPAGLVVHPAPDTAAARW
jgi:23S rRNA pseudouridine1911/1915/1917 synthase